MGVRHPTWTPSCTRPAGSQASVVNNPHRTGINRIKACCGTTVLWITDRVLQLLPTSSTDTMGLPTKNLQTVAPLLGVILLGWIVELFSLYYLQKSCHLHNTPAWAAGAGFPALGKCWKLYRFEWLTIWFEFIVVFLIIFTLTKANAIRRFRLAFVGLLAISAVLHIFSTNSTLNLQDSKPTSTFITKTELLRARIVSGSFAFGSAFTIALLIVLGEDDAPLGSGSEYDAQQPLMQPSDV